MKKTFLFGFVAVFVLTALLTSGVTYVRAQYVQTYDSTSTASLQAQIQVLLSQVAALQSQLSQKPTVNYISTSGLSAASAEIVNSQYSYYPGQTIKFSVRGIASNGTIATPASGFHVQSAMYSTNPKETVMVNGDYQSVNAEYNYKTSLWDVTMTAPSDYNQKYTIDSAFYCSNPHLGCLEIQINKTFDFTVNYYQTATPKITITSPYSGQNFPLNSKFYVQWTGGNPNDSFLLAVTASDGSVSLPGAAIPVSLGSYVWPWYPNPITSNSGTYRVKFLGVDNTLPTSDNPVLSNEVTFTSGDYPTIPTGKPTMKVDFPNGGEVYRTNGSVPFQFSYTNIQTPDTFTVYLYSPTLGYIPGYVFNYNAHANGSTGNTMNLGSDVLPGEYRITACTTITPNPAVPFKPLCDHSDTTFTVVSSTQKVYADVTGDGLVNTNDLLAVINAWGPCKPTTTAGAGCPTDINTDRTTDSKDLDLVIKNWTR